MRPSRLRASMKPIEETAVFDILRRYRVVLLPTLAIVAAGAAFFYFQEEIRAALALLSSDRTHPAIVVGSFLVLPALFFPISTLLVLVGVRFGALWGSLISLVLMPAHLLVAFFLVRHFFYARIERLARRKNSPIFNIPAERYREFGLLFMAVPGLPYTVKNYLLPVSGISFRDYFWIGWVIQGLMGIPFVVLGNAASQWSVGILALFAILFVIVFFISRKLKQRYERLVQSDPNRPSAPDACRSGGNPAC